MDVFFIEVATFLPHFVKIGQNLRERHQFFKMQDGDRHHLHSRLLGLFRYHECYVFQRRYIPTKFGEHWLKIETTTSVFQNSRWR